MSSVRLRDLPRTTAFRLALLFLALFGAASLVLFGFLYWQTAGYLIKGVDDWLAREQAEFVASDYSTLIGLVKTGAAHNPQGRRLFAAFDPSGNQIAGNLAAFPGASPPLDRPFEFQLSQGGQTVPFRGLAHRLPSGVLVLVGQNVREMREFRELLVGAMTWGGLLALAVALGGAVAIGVGTLRRIDAVTRAIERIVRGNLSERLPTRGKVGDLDHLVHAVNGMLHEIERLMQEVKGVCDGIAHDLRTPLTRLLAGLERARRRAGSIGDYGTAVDDAIDETKGILATFSALLRISEVEDGMRRSGFTNLDLATVAADVGEFYDPLAEAKGVSLQVDNDRTSGARISGDPSLMFEAIGNLVENAIKFTPPGGRVTLRSFDGKGRLGIEIVDTGPGIPAAERELVLRRFYRGEKSRHSPGSGLGLSLVTAVARLHGLGFTIEDANPGCRVLLWRDDSL
jgi:signal transduction histidine kinase